MPGSVYGDSPLPGKITAGGVTTANGMLRTNHFPPLPQISTTTSQNKGAVAIDAPNHNGAPDLAFNRYEHRGASYVQGATPNLAGSVAAYSFPCQGPPNNNAFANVSPCDHHYIPRSPLCLWIGPGDVVCGAIVNPETIGEHIREYHAQIPTLGKLETKVCCEWLTEKGAKCGAILHKGSLKKHIQNIHFEKRYECPEPKCRQSLAGEKKSLERHLIGVHSIDPGKVDLSSVNAIYAW